MTLHVQYRNGTYDYVHNRSLDRLIEENLIRQFYRPSEKRWIDVETDPVRGRILAYKLDLQRWVNVSLSSIGRTESINYTGAERRCHWAAA